MDLNPNSDGFTEGPNGRVEKLSPSKLTAAQYVVALIHLGPAVAEPRDKDKERASLDEVLAHLP